MTTSDVLGRHLKPTSVALQSRFSVLSSAIALLHRFSATTANERVLRRTHS